MKIVVIGAGVAGLVCARTLLRAGEEVTVIEASDGVGGRVRTDNVEGFRLDRGFQVLFTAYPAARRQLDFERLNLRRYEPGAVICRGAQRHVLSDPLRDPSAARSSILTNIVPLRDKLLTARLSAVVKAKTIDAILDDSDQTTEDFLRGFGFSSAYIENFIRPFFGGGIFLERRLTTSARAFQFDWKMLTEGDTATPAHGMGQIAAQLAEEIVAANRLRLTTKAEQLQFSSSGRCAGVLTTNGEILPADAIAVATPAPEAARLTGTAMPKDSVGTICLYLAGDAPVYRGKKVLLHANANPFINNAAQVTNIAPELAPPGKHLLAVTLAGMPEGDAAAWFTHTKSDLRRMFAGDNAALNALETYDLLAVYVIPYAQFAQPPGTYATLPTNESGIPGVVFAGEFTAASSLNAAMRSGEKAAGLLLTEPKQ